MKPQIAAKSSNAERRERILDGARKLIIQYGYDKTTVSDIANDAGIAKGAIYLHFESKEALFDALLQRETMRYIRKWHTRIEADPEGGTLGGIFKHTLIALHENEFMLALIRRDRKMMGNWVRSRRTQMVIDNQRIDVGFMKILQDSGNIRQDVDVETITYVFNIIRQGFITIDDMIPPEEAPDIEKVTETIYWMIEQALAPPSGGNSEAGKQVIRQIIQAFEHHFASEDEQI